MTYRKTEVAVIGGGAAGVAAARHLHEARVDYMLIEARSRLGGRAYTAHAGGHALDLGCGWFHSADSNPWPKIAQAQGRVVDKTSPPWQRPSNPAAFPAAEQRAFQIARDSLHERMERADLSRADRPVSDFLLPGERWNPLLNAVSTYISGAELDRVSARDLLAYEDDELNWRTEDGYGTVVAAHGADLNVVLDCAVQQIEWGALPLRIHTTLGVIEADRVIVALPTDVLAQQPEIFRPALPEKTQAAAGLPLGLADKLFLSLKEAEEFEKDSRVFGRTDRTATAIYHMRPFGRPLIECYFGGACAKELEAGGEAAFFDFARSELATVLGGDFARRIAPLPMHLWHSDPLARGSYSYATPGHADCRRKLAQPVDERIYFAGEACSEHSFSTAHGAYFSGVDAAELIVKAGTK